MISSKVYGMIMSLNWILKKTTDSLMSGEVKFWYWYLVMDNFGSPKANFGPLHWQGDSFAHLMLIISLCRVYSPKVTESLEMRLVFKTWPTIYLGS